MRPTARAEKIRTPDPRLRPDAGGQVFGEVPCRAVCLEDFRPRLTLEPLSASRSIFELGPADINDISAQIRVVSQHRPREMMVPRSNAEEAAKRQDRVSDV